MRKTKTRFEYRFKIKIPGKTAEKIWAINILVACHFVEQRFFYKGYKNPSYVRLSPNTIILKMTKTHKYGIKHKIAYAVKLKQRRLPIDN